MGREMTKTKPKPPKKGEEAAEDKSKSKIGGKAAEDKRNFGGKSASAAAGKRKMKVGEKSKKGEYKRIPQFRLILMILSDAGERRWLKFDDVCGSVNKMLRRHNHLHNHREKGNCKAHTHGHNIGTCDPILFPSKQTLKKLKPLYPIDGKPDVGSHCVGLNDTLYCYGGDRDIWAFHNVASETYSGCYKLKPEPLSSFLLIKNNDQNIINHHLDLQRQPRPNLSHQLIQTQIAKSKAKAKAKKRDYGCNCNSKSSSSNKSSASPSNCNCAVWRWVGSPMICPRYFPKVLPMGGKLYFFGGNRAPFPEIEKPTDVPFGEVYDPEYDGAPKALPEPPFPRIPSWAMVLLPCLGDKGEEKILVVSTAYIPDPSATVMYWYDTHDNTWAEFKDDDDEHNLLYTLVHKQGYYCASAAPVAEQNTTYWVDRGDPASFCLCCYDWKSCKLYEGEFQQHFERPFQPKFIFHLRGDLFCLIDRGGEFYVPKKKPATQFHFALFRVSKNHSNLSLDTELLGCYRSRLPGAQAMIYAHLLWEHGHSQSKSKSRESESSKEGKWGQSQVSSKKGGISLDSEQEFGRPL